MVALFVDSADRADVTRLLKTGLFAGVTTNPSILDKSGLGSRDIPDLIEWATEAGAKNVFAQAWGRTAEEIADCGESFREHGTHVTVKVTASLEGITAARMLSATGKVLVTAVYSATQVVPIIASGATYLAPFVGRMDASGRDGMGEVRAIQRAIDGSGSALQVLAGSLRTPQQILELATMGVQNVTFSPAVWDAFFTDELTAHSVEQFHALASV
ncbi:MAG: transaldolase family protein [Microbacteriaceae bacterium]